MAALTHFYVCGSCGFINTPHAFRRDKANEACEQCGTPASNQASSDVPPADAVRAKLASKI